MAAPLAGRSLPLTLTPVSSLRQVAQSVNSSIRPSYVAASVSPFSFRKAINSLIIPCISSIYQSLHIALSFQGRLSSHRPIPKHERIASMSSGVSGVTSVGQTFCELIITQRTDLPPIRISLGSLPFMVTPFI